MQAEAKIHRTERRLALGATAALTPAASAGAGPGWRLEGEAAYALAKGLTIAGKVGALATERSQARRYWDVGATATWKKLAFDLRYVGTDLSRAQCFSTAWCEPAVVGKLTYTLPLARLGT